MAGNAAQVLAAEMERVKDGLPVLFDRDDTFYSQVEKRPVEVISTRDMRIPLELRPGGKSGHYDPDGGDLGRGDMPTYDKAVINTIHLRHALEWTAKREWATDSDRKAIVNTFRRDLASGMAQFRRFLDSLCMGGSNGVLGTISAVSSGGGTDTYTLATDGFGARLLHYGQDIRVFTSNLGTDRTAAGERTISFIDIENKQIKVAAVSGAVATDKIVASGLTATPPTSIFGVQYHQSNASTGTWLGFDRSLVPEIRSNRVNANSGVLSLPMPRLAMNKIGDRLGKNRRGSKLVAWTHPAQKQQYEEMGQELVSIVNQPKGKEGLDLYFNDNMRLAGAPLECSYGWDRTRIDFIDYDLWGRAEFHPIGWYTVDGQKIFAVRGSSGGVATANVSYLVCSWNLFTMNPAGGAYIDALAVPSGY